MVVTHAAFGSYPQQGSVLGPLRSWRAWGCCAPSADSAPCGGWRRDVEGWTVIHPTRAARGVIDGWGKYLRWLDCPSVLEVCREEEKTDQFNSVKRWKMKWREEDEHHHRQKKKNRDGDRGSGDSLLIWLLALCSLIIMSDLHWYVHRQALTSVIPQKCLPSQSTYTLSPPLSHS